MKRSPMPPRSTPLRSTGKPKAKTAAKKKALSASMLRKKALTLWGRYVHQRDVYCQLCGRGDGKLDAHHIMRKERNATRTDENNGVLLCAYPCHKSIMHGDEFQAVQFYTRRLGVEGYANLRQKAYDGINGKYPVSFWKAECERLAGLLEEQEKTPVSDERRHWVLLECKYAHLLQPGQPIPKVGDLFMCGKHHSSHKVTEVFGVE